MPKTIFFLIFFQLIIQIVKSGVLSPSTDTRNHERALSRGREGEGSWVKWIRLLFIIVYQFALNIFIWQKLFEKEMSKECVIKKPKHWSHVSGLRFCVLGRGFFYPGSSVLGFESQVLGPGSWRSYYKVCQEVITKCDRPRIVWKLLRSE